VSEEAAVASEGETRTRLGAGAGLAEADARTDVEDADVVVAEGVETRTRTRACGDACNDAEDAADGEGEATLTRTRLGADAGPADANDGEAIADVDVVGVPTRCRFGVAVFCCCGAFRARDFLDVTPTDARNAARCKSSASRRMSVPCMPWATTSSCFNPATSLTDRFQASAYRSRVCSVCTAKLASCTSKLVSGYNILGPLPAALSC
jgi:hypothetical protein